MNLDPDVPGTAACVGRPLGTVEVKILDQSGNLLPAGIEGEIAVRSAALPTAYSAAPAADRAAFRDGWFLPGDLGKKDGAGRLYITGRKRRFIDSGGWKVDPAEVEEVLKTHPLVENTP